MTYAQMEELALEIVNSLVKKDLIISDARYTLERAIQIIDTQTKLTEIK